MPATCEQDRFELAHEPEIDEVADHGDADLVDVRGQGGKSFAADQAPGGAAGQAHHHEDVKRNLFGVAGRVTRNIRQHLDMDQTHHGRILNETFRLELINSIKGQNQECLARYFTDESSLLFIMDQLNQ